ncbi:hypothetical protein OIU80_15535 [Flavobacterium sp. LS1R47]|uniref:Uncharacterized protein n=1 Tax=Flavobacterium frigoritolerans TaxID=2987686 RepID=A0A9X2ZMV0_9FLAO|nr:hypothetical protein [Flavobacterium frigoritolerans]MCV9933695.1 hypothetical protein [Flavobacterium frigoritolerans]
MEANENCKFDYWEFIEKYYPNYYSCDDILMNDILYRKIHNEEICEEDEEMIKDWDVKSELLKLDKMIFFKALEKYFEIHYS